MNFCALSFLFQLRNCEGIMERVKAIAFTDSVHSLSHQRADKNLRAWMKRVLEN